MPTLTGPPLTVLADDHGVIAHFSNSLLLLVRVLESNLFQVKVGNISTEEKKSWIVVDSTGDVPWEGRDKLDYSRFSSPRIQTKSTSYGHEIETEVLRIQINWTHDVRIQCFHKEHGLFFSDTQFDAYRFAEEVDFRHSVSILDNEEYYGFGEPAGGLNKNGLRLRVDAKDSMGYDAEFSDPLYKHWPYHMTVLPSPTKSNKKICYGLLYDTMRRSVFDLGKEISAFRGKYRYFETSHWEKGLDYYLFYGEKPERISESLIHLIGSPAIPPRWALGYLGSSMVYTEADDAMVQLNHYLDLLKQYDIPCNGFHLSSGYTVDEKGRRCVFTWNKQRIPDPEQLFANFNSRNVFVIANVKPWLLNIHPMFKDVLSFRGFFESHANPGQPSYGRFWLGGAGTSGLGCYLDFTNQETREWWKFHAKHSLLDLGCKALWNDNNEYEVDESKAVCKLDQTSVDSLGRGLQTLLMARTSQEALIEKNPEDVLVISRSGSIGTHRYAAQTWSGDNSTSWKTLKYNISMCLSLGLSGWPGSGPDIGGFAGEKPTPELFWRWVQSGVFMPRFSIHSSPWKNQNATAFETPTTNEPWMFPAYTKAIQNSIRFRTRLKVLLHSLHIEANQIGSPVIRPIFYHYFDEPTSFSENFKFLLGKDLFVSPIIEPNDVQFSAFLPDSTSFWFDLDSNKYYRGGSEIRNSLKGLEASENSLFGGCPVFLRENGGLILSGSSLENNEDIDENGRLLILALNEKCFAEYSWYEDEAWFVKATCHEKNEVSVHASAQHGIGQTRNKRIKLSSPNFPQLIRVVACQGTKNSDKFEKIIDKMVSIKIVSSL